MNYNNYCEQTNRLQHKKKLHELNLLKQKKADEIRNKTLQMSQEVTFIRLGVIFKFCKIFII